MSGKRYIRLLLLAAAVLPALWSCSDDDVASVTDGGLDHVTLYLSTNPAVSRADATPSDGEDPYNENKVDAIDLYFYPNNGLGDGDKEIAALLHIPSARVSYEGDGYSVASGLKHKLSFTLSKEEAERLFPNGATSNCYVRAIVNGSADLINSLKGTDNADRPTLSALEAAKIAAAEGIRDFKAAEAPAHFVMYSHNAIQLMQDNDGAISATGNAVLQVSRVAAKIRLAVRVDQAIYMDPTTGETVATYPRSLTSDETMAQFEAEVTYGETNLADALGKGLVVRWTSNLQNMRVYISDGVAAARLDGYAGERKEESDELKEDSRWMEDEDFYYITPSVANDAQTGNDYNDYNLARLLLDPKATTLPEGVTRPESLPDAPEEYPYYNWLPFYSYPNVWDNTSDEVHRTYLTVVVPWTMHDGNSESYQYTTYQVPVNTKTNDIQSNTYYRIRLHIGVLGSFDLDEPLELEPRYEILPWGYEDIDVSLKEMRYLVVNQPEWQMNNIETITVPFYTSHETVVKDVFIYYYHFNDNGNTGGEVQHMISESFSADQNYTNGSINSATYNHPTDNPRQKYLYEFSIDSKKQTLTLVHPLSLWQEYARINGTDQQLPYTTLWGYGDTYSHDDVEWFQLVEGKTAFSRYLIKIVLVHKDMINETATPFLDTITVTQYPPIYITNTLNNVSGARATDYFSAGYVSVNGHAETDGARTSGGQNNTTTNRRKYSYGAVNNMSNSNNSNRNMYTITVTQLNADDESTKDFIIGDPRTLDYNINLSDESFSNANTAHTLWTDFSVRSENTNYYYYGPVTAPSMYNGSGDAQNLRFYYPADETPKGTAGSKYNMIAPKFRIASSWGATNNLRYSKMLARRRCATYQEMGYPAGRWRLPTTAEVKYIVQLSAEGRIPTLFGGGNSAAYYYTAQGVVSVNGSTVNEDAEEDDPVVRCVYDDWYWVKEDAATGEFVEDRLPQDQWSTFTWGDKEKVDPEAHD